MHKDATGRQIKRGDYIAYATANRSSSGVKFGAVVKLKQKDVDRHRFNQQTKAYDTVTETQYTIAIISVDKGSKFDQQTQTYSSQWVLQGKLEDEGRPARTQSIERLERVILLNPDQMEPEAKEIIDRELYSRGAI